MIRAVSAPTVAPDELGVVVELADRKTVVLPFGKRSVALTWIDIHLSEVIVALVVVFASAMDSIEGTGRIESIPEEVDVLGHNVMTGC